ncbi:bile acid:sodium symporter family protein [Novosphingobium sp. EMRT-2]|uniref:bile acid:sodium symporter family protein n=1 Tax=Novosphingobium sp. EMRT-2 TaxID=2571749 RepID=UPI0010BCEF85|nr:bile acid:sodium symporter family protein [Novosphingobium sp. EMRT-2]QCI95353.1 bile acid:sodium symporter [Novosphingobium sp. EMRT-2]
MIRKLAALVEPFILALLGTVLLASVLPARGQWAAVAERAADAGIVLLFFLHGAKLSREAIWDGMRNWKLHLATLGVTFALFPALGLAFGKLPFVPPAFATGLLFLTLLPSTVQSSIAFTAIARGNVAAAVCAASFSNFVGIFATPALVALLMGGTTGGISWQSVETILLQLLLPFVVGHLLRPWVGAFVARHKALVGRVDRGSILLVVYSAFGAAVVEGLWQRVSPESLVVLSVLCVVLLGIALLLTTLLGRAMKLPRADAAVLLFCGSKKSLASGVPMAGVLFAPAQVGIVLLPVMLFHQFQLIACAMIAPRLAAAAEKDAGQEGNPTSV